MKRATMCQISLWFMNHRSASEFENFFKSQVKSGMESGKSTKIKVESGVEWPLSTLRGFSTFNRPTLSTYRLLFPFYYFFKVQQKSQPRFEPRFGFNSKLNSKLFLNAHLTQN